MSQRPSSPAIAAARGSAVCSCCRGSWPCSTGALWWWSTAASMHVPGYWRVTWGLWCGDCSGSTLVVRFGKVARCERDEHEGNTEQEPTLGAIGAYPMELLKPSGLVALSHPIATRWEVFSLAKCTGNHSGDEVPWSFVSWCLHLFGDSGSFGHGQQDALWVSSLHSLTSTVFQVFAASI